MNESFRLRAAGESTWSVLVAHNMTEAVTIAQRLANSQNRVHILTRYDTGTTYRVVPGAEVEACS